MSLGRLNEARESLAAMLQIMERLRLSEECDPMTTWDLLSTQLAFTCYGDPTEAIQVLTPHLLTVMNPFFEEGGRRADVAAQMVAGHVRSCAHILLALNKGPELLQLLDAVEAHAPKEVPSLNEHLWVYQIEGLIAAGRSSEAELFADQLRSRGHGVGQSLSRFAADQQLQRAASLLR